MPSTQIHYFTSAPGLHDLESMLDNNGRFRPQSQQGELSRYVESVSQKLMSRPPAVRRHITLGVMSVFQRYWGQEPPINADTDSLAKNIAGIMPAIGALLN